jgi:hypothetical protein
MTEPLIAKITDPDAGMVEMLQEAQLLIDQRNVYQLALENACHEAADSYYREALKQLESEKITSGKVC